MVYPRTTSLDVRGRDRQAEANMGGTVGLSHGGKVGRGRGEGGF